MRRVLPRIVLPLTLVAALGVGVAPGASAQLRSSRDLVHIGLPQELTQRLQAGMSSLLHGGIVPSTSSGVAVDGSDLELSGGFQVAGSPYHWGLGLTHTRTGFELYVIGVRNFGFGQANEFHAWNFALPRGAGSIGPGLHRGHVHTGHALGSFGKIDLSFSSFRPRKAQTFTCGPGQPRVTEGFDRRGTLKGSLDFTPNEGTLPDLHLTHMRAAITRYRRFKSFPCGEPGPHRKPHCYAEQQVSVADPTQKVEAQFQGPNDLDVSTFKRSKGFLEVHDLDVSSFTRISRVTAAGLDVDASGLSPLFSGSLAFHTGAVTHHRGALCRIMRSKELWSSGTLTANLDSGAIDLTGSGLQGSVIVHKRP